MHCHWYRERCVCSECVLGGCVERQRPVSRSMHYHWYKGVTWEGRGGEVYWGSLRRGYVERVY